MEGLPCGQPCHPPPVTWSPLRNLTFLKRRTTPPSPFDGRSHSPTSGLILPSPLPTHGLNPSTPFLSSPPPPFTPPQPKAGTEGWPSPTPSLLQPPEGGGQAAHAYWGFRDLHHMTPTLLIVSQDAVDQLEHTDTSRDLPVPPPANGKVSSCHLCTFLVLSSEYRIALQAGSAYIAVTATRIDESHLT